MPTTTTAIFRARRVRISLIQLAALSAVWWTITEGAPGAWLIGVPAIVFTMVLLARSNPGSEFALRLSAVPEFVGFFVAHSFLAGIDVARRAFSPQCNLRPNILVVAWQLPPGAPRSLAAIVMNLLPGTLTVENREHDVHVHAIDADVPIGEEIQRIEQHVAALFGLSLESPERPQ